MRESNPVFRLVPGAVDQQLSDWAKGGQLAHVLRVATGQDSDPHAAAHKPTTFTTDGLNKALPGFADLNRGEKMMVISTLARLSHTAHEQYGVNGNPIDTGKESEGALKHKEIGVKAKKLMDKLGLKHLGDAGHIPDLSNRNYAVIELDGPHGIEYVVDSSYPNKKESAESTPNATSTTGSPRSTRRAAPITRFPPCTPSGSRAATRRAASAVPTARIC